MANERTNNPEEPFRDLLMRGENWRSKLTKIQLANFERQSKVFREKFDAQNKQASLEAIKNNDLMALRVRTCDIVF